MKAKFTRVGKRSLSVILTLMMIVSTMLVGMVSVGAAISGLDALYYTPDTVHWDKDGASFKLRYVTDDNTEGSSDFVLIASNPNVYKATLDSSKTYNKLQFQRWTNSYNDNSSIEFDTIPTSGANYFKKTSDWWNSWDPTKSDQGTWSTYGDTGTKYYVVGILPNGTTDWNSTSYPLEKQSDGKYTWTYKNTSGSDKSYGVKVMSSSGAYYPDSNDNTEIPGTLNNGYTLTVTFDPTNSSTPVTCTQSGGSTGASTWKISGPGVSGWGADKGKELSLVSGYTNRYSITLDGGLGQWFGFYKGNDQYGPINNTNLGKGEDNSVTITKNTNAFEYLSTKDDKPVTVILEESAEAGVKVWYVTSPSTHKITVEQPSQGGTIKVTDESGNTLSDLKAVPKDTKFKVVADTTTSGWSFSSATVMNGSESLTPDAEGVYIMPDADVTVTATFTDKTSDTPTPKYALCGGIGAGWGSYDANYLVDTHDTEVVPGNNNIFKRQVKIDGQKYFRLISKDGETTAQYAPVDASYENPFDVTSADSYVNKKATKVDTGASFKIPSAGTYTIYVDQSGTTPSVWVVKESVDVTYTVYAQSNDTNMGTVSPDSQTCTSGGSVSFTASEKSGVFAGWYDSSSYTNKIGSELKLTLKNVTADRTVYAKFESSAKPVTVYAMNPLNSSGYINSKASTPTVSMGETVLGTSLTDDYNKETNTNNSYNLYKITPGDVVTIKTQLNEKAVQANYYVYAFVINGETVLANNMGSGKYTASYTVGSENLEITPVYFNQTIKDNGDYITFYADATEVSEKWGNTVACYPYYYDGKTWQEDGKDKPCAYQDAAYPGQPMLKNSQGQYFTVVPRYYYEYSDTNGTITKKEKTGTEYYPITGVTLNNYYAKDSVHANFLTSAQKNYLQSFDYNDFKYIADKKDAEGNPLYDTIWFDNKNRTYSESNKTYVGTLAVGNTKSTLISDIEGRNGWDEFYDGVNEETANKVGLLGDRDIDTNLPSLYVVSVGNINDPNLGEWSVNWYVFDSNGKLLFIDHPSAFIDDTSSAYKFISGTDGANTTDYSKNPVKITFETADTRNDGRWYYANSKKVDPYNIEVFAQYKSDDGSYVNCTNKNSDITLPFVCDTYGFSIGIDGQAVKTYTEINNTAELKVNTLPDGWIFDGWGYIRTNDGVYVPFSSTDSLQTITLSGAGKFVARFSPVPKGSVALSHGMYDGPNASKGDGVRYIKAVLTDAHGNTNVYDFTTGTIQIPEVTKDCKITVTLKTVCTGINEFQTWYELVDGEYQIIGGEVSDQGRTGTVEYSWDITGADLFVGDKLTYSTLNFYSDIASKTANAVLTYRYFDRFNVQKSYVVTVTLTPEEINNNFKPSNATIYANAPAITDIYKNCIWKLTDSSRVSYAGSNATIDAVHSDTTYKVHIKDEKATPTTDLISDIPLNSYLKKNDQFITAADPASFKYWKVVRTDDPSREVAKCFSPTFNLVIVDDYTITAVYDGTASSSVTIGDANYTREQYTDESGKPVDRLYADFIVAYMNKSHTMITENSDKYHTGIIIEVDANAKITVDVDGKPSNYKEVEFKSVNIQDCATGTGNGADIKADGYANVVTIDDGNGSSHKRIIYKHEIDNTKYNNFNRLDYFVSFKNSSANRLFVMKATYYVYYYDVNGKIVYEESKPVYFNLYDIGTSTVVTDK